MTATINRPTDVATCGATTMTLAGRVFVCNAQPHPSSPDKHYFSLDTEATLHAQSPSNARLESAVESHLRLEVRKLGGTAIKLLPTIKGLPDRLIVMPGGRVYFVELKAANGRVSAAQRLWHDRLRALGCHVAVLFDKADVSLWIREITEAAGPQFRRTTDAEHD
jgi:hypothetical protein